MQKPYAIFLIAQTNYEYIFLFRISLVLPTIAAALTRQLYSTENLIAMNGFLIKNDDNVRRHLLVERLQLMVI